MNNIFLNDQQLLVQFIQNKIDFNIYSVPIWEALSKLDVSKIDPNDIIPISSFWSYVSSIATCYTNLNFENLPYVLLKPIFKCYEIAFSLYSQIEKVDSSFAAMPLLSLFGFYSEPFLIPDFPDHYPISEIFYHKLLPPQVYIIQLVGQTILPKYFQIAPYIATYIAKHFKYSHDNPICSWFWKEPISYPSKTIDSNSSNTSTEQTPNTPTEQPANTPTEQTPNTPTEQTPNTPTEQTSVSQKHGKKNSRSHMLHRCRQKKQRYNISKLESKKIFIGAKENLLPILEFFDSQQISSDESFQALIIRYLISDFFSDSFVSPLEFPKELGNIYDLFLNHQYLPAVLYSFNSEKPDFNFKIPIKNVISICLTTGFKPYDWKSLTPEQKKMPSSVIAGYFSSPEICQPFIKEFIQKNCITPLFPESTDQLVKDSISNPLKAVYLANLKNCQSLLNPGVIFHEQIRFFVDHKSFNVPLTNQINSLNFFNFLYLYLHHKLNDKNKILSLLKIVFEEGQKLIQKSIPSQTFESLLFSDEVNSKNSFYFPECLIQINSMTLIDLWLYGLTLSVLPLFSDESNLTLTEKKSIVQQLLLISNDSHFPFCHKYLSSVFQSSQSFSNFIIESYIKNIQDPTHIKELASQFISCPYHPAIRPVLEKIFDLKDANSFGHLLQYHPSMSNIVYSHFIERCFNEGVRLVILSENMNAITNFISCIYNKLTISNSKDFQTILNIISITSEYALSKPSLIQMIFHIIPCNHRFGGYFLSLISKLDFGNEVSNQFINLIIYVLSQQKTISNSTYFKGINPIFLPSEDMFNLPSEKETPTIPSSDISLFTKPLTKDFLIPSSISLTNPQDQIKFNWKEDPSSESEEASMNQLSLWTDTTLSDKCHKDVSQCSFICYTCGLTNKPICLNCALTCHHNHHIVFSGEQSFTCSCSDCSSTGTNHWSTPSLPLQLINESESQYYLLHPSIVLTLFNKLSKAKIISSSDSFSFQSSPSDIPLTVLDAVKGGFSLKQSQKLNSIKAPSCSSLIDSLISNDTVSITRRQNCVPLQIAIIAGENNQYLIYGSKTTLQLYDISLKNPKRISELNIHHTPLQLVVCPLDPTIVAVASLHHVFIISINDGKIVIEHEVELMLETLEPFIFVNSIFWIPLRVLHLGVVCNAFFKVYDIPSDCFSPVACFNVKDSDFISSACFTQIDDRAFGIFSLHSEGISIMEIPAENPGNVIKFSHFLPIGGDLPMLSVCEEARLLAVSPQKGPIQLVRISPELIALAGYGAENIGSLEKVTVNSFTDQQSFIGFDSSLNAAVMCNSYGCVSLLKFTSSGLIPYFGIEQDSVNFIANKIYSMGYFSDGEKILSISPNGQILEFSHGSQPPKPITRSIPYLRPSPSFWSKCFEIPLSSLSMESPQLIDDCKFLATGAALSLPPHMKNKKIRFRSLDSSLIIVGVRININSQAVLKLEDQCFNAKAHTYVEFVLKPKDLGVKKDYILEIESDSSDSVVIQELKVFVVDKKEVSSFIDEKTEPIQRDWENESLVEFDPAGMSSEPLNILAQMYAPYEVENESLEEAVGLLYTKNDAASRLILSKLAKVDVDVDEIWRKTIRKALQNSKVAPENWNLLWRDLSKLKECPEKDELMNFVWKSKPELVGKNCAIVAFFSH